MKKFIHILAFTALVLAFLPASARKKEKAPDGVFLHQLQERDSILIADQLRYGVRFSNVADGVTFQAAQWPDSLMMDVDMVKGWSVDTLAVNGSRKAVTSRDLEIAVVLTSFEEGVHVLPDIILRRVGPDEKADTLVFDGLSFEMCTMPVDTATFVVHDIKAQIRYPVTFAEVLPYIGGAVALAAIIAGLIFLVRKMRRRRDGQPEFVEPAHIVALRTLDKYRGESFWEPQKQKIFYSGVTDALREYMDARYGVAAMEMTTPEILQALKKTDISAENFEDIKVLFERADFVKFAKHVASREENAEVLPFAVKFVTTTYQEEIESPQNEK